MLWDLVEGMRPRQWLKNVLLLAAPAAAGVLDEVEAVARVTAGIVLFVVVSSGQYLVNDAVDVDADRIHPDKASRPVPSGRLPESTARAAGLVLMAAGLAVSAAVMRGPFTWTLVAYVGLSLSYSLGLKRQPVIELALVSSGFVLRALAGGYAVAVPISDWFLIVALFGSLFIVVAKRRAELRMLGAASADHRVALAAYPERYLDHVMTATAAVVILAYCLWAFETAATVDQGLAYRVSVVPFTLVLLRYALVVDTGTGGGAPEEVVLGDRVLQVLAVAWAACFAAGVYAGG